MTTEHHLNRRQFERQPVCAMYSEISVRPVGGETGENPEEARCGHVYDISEGGLRLELDEAMEMGEQLAVDVRLPGEDGSWGMTAAVVWVNDEIDDPGPRRMALEFSGFSSEQDHRRLVQYLGRGTGRLAA